MFRIIFRSVLILMLIAVAAPAPAQEAEPEKAPPQDVDKAIEEADEEAAAVGEGRVFKDQIVVTPGRQEQASGDAPAPITVFDRETITGETLLDAFRRQLDYLDFVRRFDTVTIIDVLEHIEDDVTQLRRIFDVLTDGGRLVVAVPACPAERAIELHRPSPEVPIEDLR